MMKKILLTLMSLVIIPLLLGYAQAGVDGGDSIRVYELEPYVVTATRSQILLKNCPSTVDVITRKNLDEVNASTLGEAILEKNGVIVKEYGAEASLKTISIRGTSSEQTLVLMNGTRMNNFQNGLVDLSQIPLDNVEKIEIIHGGNSALYGTDAVGGVINIISETPAEKLKFNLRGGLGSFSYTKYSASLSQRFYDVGFMLGIQDEYGKENYKYAINGSIQRVVKERENASFKRNNLYLAIDYKTDGNNLQIISSFYNSSQGIPGSLTYVSPTERQIDKRLITQILWNNSSYNNILLQLASNVLYSFERSTNRLWSPESFSKNITYTINPKIEYVVGDTMMFVVGGQFTHGGLEGTDFYSKYFREQQSVFVASNISVKIDSKFLNHLFIYPAVNYEKYSGLNGKILPKVGLSAEIVDGYDIRTSYGLNYRIPTLNDLYYRDSWGSIGNLFLKPEHSENFDVGLSSILGNYGKATLDLSYFYINTTDKIIWQPNLNGTYSPQNIGNVLSQGVCAKLNYSILNNFNLEISHTFTDARKKNKSSDNDPTYNKNLIYSPKNVSKLCWSLRFGVLSVNLYQLFIGKRYSDPNNQNLMPAYSVLNGNLLLKVPVSWGKLSAKLEVNNISDEDYQVIYDYPMPPRNYKLTLGFEY
jgi:outer membrane cobalamin receptor